MDIYLDAAASALKPGAVIKAETDFLANHYANAGRGICPRAAAVDKTVEDCRSDLANFIGAKPSQIVFTGGATDGLNRIANMLSADSLVAVSDIEHHSARLPFEARHKTIVYDETPPANCDALVWTAMSNVLGIARETRAMDHGSRITIVDAAQYVAHLPIDVKQWNCDFLVFSGHKIGADTGVGVLYIKEPDRWQTDRFGGGQYQATGPARFEAGTLPLTQIAGLRVAIENRGPGIKDLVLYLRGELEKIPRIRFISPADSYLITFVIDGMHYLDFGALMGAYGICIRVGNMCASWLHKKLGLQGSIRMSIGPWNTMAEMEEVVRCVKKILS